MAKYATIIVLLLLVPSVVFAEGSITVNPEITSQILVLQNQTALGIQQDGTQVGTLEIILSDIFVGDLINLEVRQESTLAANINIENNGSLITLKAVTPKTGSIAEIDDDCSLVSEQVVCTVTHELWNIFGNRGFMDYILRFNKALSESNESTLDLVYQGQVIGSMDVDFDSISFEDPLPSLISKVFQGIVTYSDTSEYSSGQLLVEDAESDSLGNFEIMAGSYTAQIQALPDTQVKFFIDNVIVHEQLITAEPETITLDLQVPTLPEGNFPDEDRDGVPDSLDQCQGSNATLVNEQGCACHQIACDQSACIIEDLRPVCRETCSDGFKNQDEEDIDCGGVCGSCDYFLEEGCTDCNDCGCSEGFTCHVNGTCSQVLQLEATTCKQNDFAVFTEPVNCAGLGHTFIEENKDNYVSFEITGFPIIKWFAEDTVEEAYDDFTVCLNTLPLGCFHMDFQCPGRSVYEAEIDTIESLVELELLDKVDLNWFLDIFVDIEYEVDLTNFKLENTAACTTAIHEEDLCTPLTENEAKGIVDMLIILTGFDTEEEQLEYVLRLRENHLISNDQINVFTIFADDIAFEEDPTQPGAGEIPSVEDILTEANNCPGVDATVLLSGQNDFNPHCVGTNPLCSIPVGNDQDPGELLLKLFGSKLNPEDLGPIESLFFKDNPDVFEDLLDLKLGFEVCPGVDLSDKTLVELTLMLITASCFDDPVVPPIIDDSILVDKVLAFGDSITFGETLENPQTENWAYLLGQSNNVPVINYAISGSVAEDVLRNQLPQIDTSSDEKLIILWVGANDIRTLTSFSEFKENYERILDNLVQVNNAHVVIVNVPDFSQIVTEELFEEGLLHYFFDLQDDIPDFEDYVRDFVADPYRDEVNTLIDFYNTVILNVAAEHNVPIIDVSKVPLHPSLVASDGFHPNKQGQVFIEGIISDEIERIFPNLAFE